MPLSVDVVFLQRRTNATATSVEVVWLFTTGPDFTSQIAALDWGNGALQVIVPPSGPSPAFTYTHTYPAGAEFFGTASFAAALAGQGGYQFLTNVAVSIDAEATEGVLRVVEPFSLDSLVVGGFGNDTLISGAQEDTVYAGVGNDTVFAGRGRDVLYGEQGNDTLDGGDGNDNLTGNAGNDLLYGGKGQDILYGNDGNDTLNGGTGNDTLYGDNGRDRLLGGHGNDLLYGGAEADTIAGDFGADTIQGGFGADRLITKADGARDVFRYDSLLEGGDVILGFINGQDVIQVEFADPGPLLIGAAPVPDLPIGTYLFNTSTSRFSYDPDGTGPQAAVLIATLVGVTSFSGSDLFFT
jgi:Ca2+-binding RTX toxin-like protein